MSTTFWILAGAVGWLVLSALVAWFAGAVAGAQTPRPPYKDGPAQVDGLPGPRDTRSKPHA